MEVTKGEPLLLRRRLCNEADLLVDGWMGVT